MNPKYEATRRMRAALRVRPERPSGRMWLGGLPYDHTGYWMITNMFKNGKPVCRWVGWI